MFLKRLLGITGILGMLSFGCWLEEKKGKWGSWDVGMGWDGMLSVRRGGKEWKIGERLQTARVFLGCRSNFRGF